MEVSSSNTLVNVIRQILDYYLLQLCGYSGVSIKDEILKKHRDDFVTKLPDGTEDCSELHMVASLLQYLCTSNDRISDGLNFIHTSIDVESCRRIFEKIFRHMGQGQHFDMIDETAATVTCKINKGGIPINFRQESTFLLYMLNMLIKSQLLWVSSVGEIFQHPSRSIQYLLCLFSEQFISPYSIHLSDLRSGKI